MILNRLLTLLPLFLLSLSVVVLVLNRYAKLSKIPHFVLGVIIVSWTIPFSAFFLLPMDLASTNYDTCLKRLERLDDSALNPCEQPWFYLDSQALYVVWRIVYWTSFALTWLIIPVLEYYLDRGGFDWKRKLRWALSKQMLYFIAIAIGGAIFLFYIAYKKQLSSFTAIRGYVMAIANCWGLILIISFMGYGLIDVPRKLWAKSFLKKRLVKLEKEAPKARDKVLDSESALRDIIDEFQIAAQRLGSNHELSELITKILNELETYDGFNEINLGFYQRNDRIPEASNPIEIDKKYLEAIHLKLKRNLIKREREVALWQQLLKDAFMVQDILRCANSSDRKLTSELILLSGSKWDDFQTSLSWWYYVILQPWCLRITSLIMLLVTCVLIWSELTIRFKNPPLSLVAILFLKLGDMIGVLQIISSILVLYMSYCAYSTLFQVKIFNYYVLVANQHTDSISLLLCGEYLCKLAMPLYYNFLMLASVSSKGSVFYGLMGEMNLVPFLGDKFNFYFPWLILIPVIVSLTNIHRKIFSYFSVDSILYDDQDDISNLREGRDLLKNERAKEERRIQNQLSNNRNHNQYNVISSSESGFNSYNQQASRSIAVEITQPDDRSIHSNELNEEANLSTSQKIRRYFSSWRKATSSDMRSSTPEVYTALEMDADDDNMDEDEDLQYLRGFTNRS